jgi:hypothetical protein
MEGVRPPSEPRRTKFDNGGRRAVHWVAVLLEFCQSGQAVAQILSG